MQDHAPPMSLSPSQPPHDHARNFTISRRRFSQQAAVAAAAVLSPASSFAVIHDCNGHSASPTTSDLSPEQSQEVEARLANIIRKYGDRLSQEQRSHLRRILTYNQRMLASVRAFPLQNGDSPASVLKVSLVEEGMP
jgi:hypothetical protein